MDENVNPKILTETVPKWARFDARFYCTRCFCAARAERAIHCLQPDPCPLKNAEAPELAILLAQSRGGSSARLELEILAYCAPILEPVETYV